MSKGMPFASFQELCKRTGLAATHQRYLIFQTVVALHDNPTPEEVFDRVRRMMPSISLATVYKNIDTFVGHGMLRDISPNYGSRRIELAAPPHDHFVCRSCRRVFDLKKHTKVARPVRAELPPGTAFEYHLVEFVGLCRDCKQRLQKPPARTSTAT